MEFFTVGERKSRSDGYIVEPRFIVDHASDFMVRAKNFYAIWDEENNIWSKEPLKPRQVVDDALRAYADDLAKKTDQNISVQYLSVFGQPWQNYCRYLSLMPDTYHELDRKVRFSNEELTKEDYASFKLDYPLMDAPCPSYERLMTTLYEPEELDKLEWAVGAVIQGDSKRIQKFIALTGAPGSGKSTFLNIIEMLFGGYLKTFEAKELGMTNQQFATEVFKDNPLVAIQQEGDLSNIKLNIKLNSIVSHDRMIIHEKHKPAYEIRLDTFLFIASNTPVMITDSQSGLLRRLIDVHPTGNLLDSDEYEYRMSQIPFELSGIAWRCLQTYKRLGRNYYNKYRPTEMLYKTNQIFNFADAQYDVLRNMDYVTLEQLWGMYKEYCEDSGDGPEYRLRKTAFREEMKSYFNDYWPTKRLGDGTQKRKVYGGFRKQLFAVGYEGEANDKNMQEEYEPMKLSLESIVSELDEMLADCPAQYASAKETPLQKWEKVTTTLKELDTTKLHYIFFPEDMKNHIVIDFDLKDENGEKSAELNLVEAAKFPATYAEFSKGGAGVHLHYIYDGDVSKLSALYAPGIEVKVFNGNSSLRRKLTYCNDLPVAHIGSGLPLKEAKKVVSFDRISSERGLRNMIERNLRKEIVPATKPSIDFIYKDLERAYSDGMVYDVNDMRPKILAFAARSSHQADYCIKLVSKMKFASEKPSEFENGGEAPMAVYDVECYQNLFLVCWKQLGEEHKVVKMFNPSPQDVERLFSFRLISFNGSAYDSQLMYARYLGYSNMDLYNLSKKLISAPKGEAWKYKFKEARNVEYADIYDFASKKQSLKKWQIELKIHHQESEPDWDKPLPEDKWEECGEYCANDVISTEALFNHLQGDFIARQILADIAGMPINTSTNTLVAKIIFGNERKPKLVYTDLRNGEQWTEERRWYNDLEVE